MHPREGWTEEGGPWRLTRRNFLRQTAGAGLVLGGVGSLLEACGSSAGTSSSGGTTALPLPRPNHPVTWPIYPDNKPIKSGLAAETNTTLKIYNWTAYINQAVVNAFAKKYNVKVQVSTFNTMDEALAKIHSGQVSFDVFLGVTIDVLGPLIAQKFIQPINHSYIPNISQAWPDYQNPFYDRKWQYTVPYTIYTTGISWRKDHVPENPYQMANPWSMLWQPKYKGKVAILDDYREGISLGLMKNGIYNLNTTSPTQIDNSGQALQNLSSLTNMQINNNDYTQIPSGQTWIHHAWSGDIAAAQSYMPKGVPVDVVGYWFPPDGKGPVGNDLITILRTASNPVLAHLFMNYMLDLQNALTNISWNGYMQPLTEVTPQRLVKEQILPPSLMSTVVLPSYFRRGVMELQLPTQTNLLWEQAWQAASKGV
ncbi:MAG TPA: spermidine/putrescine ABC transporter substrate-binding protein [Streptosporangiaceae bacterium]|jgi:spermidine/putrescine transport system substrate-binding protein